MKLLTCIVFALCSIQPSFAKLKGKVKIDGSSTVYPITEAIAEEFRGVHPRVRVNIGVSGTGGGFKKFLTGETDINNASRLIKDSEVKKAKKNKIQFMKIPVALDGITVVVNPKNTWAVNMTPAELKRIWDKGSKVTKWSQVRKGWPEKEIKLYGPGTDSGTFDYFTEAINGKSHRSRSDYTSSEDDNVLVQGVAGDLGALGYFGFAYYSENKGKLKAVKINGVIPTLETINKGTYKPLAREIFIYLNKSSAKRVEVKTFVDFYLNKAPLLVKDVGYIPLPASTYTKSIKELTQL